MEYYQVPDQNLIIENTIGEPDVCFYDVRQEPFEVYGLYQYKTEPKFKRMSDEAAKNTSEGVKALAHNTAGGRVRFCTDSQYIAIKAEMPWLCLMPHMAMTGSAGFDLYVDSPETGLSRFFGAYCPAVNASGGFESKICFPEKKRRYVTINFPTYSDVINLYIGLQQEAKVGPGMPYRSELPVVYYGSSITQGGCVSRPGNTYEAVVGRKLNLDHINLGFSGNGRGEDAMIEYLASLPMLAFVSDYDHNSRSTEHLKSTHCKLYSAVRAAHPDIPYIMMSCTDLINRNDKTILDNRRVVLDTYDYARAQGDQNVYFIDGREIFRGPYEDQCTVDGVHPNDLGFALMADAVESTLREALIKNCI